jgi:hypothetical protein
MGWKPVVRTFALVGVALSVTTSQTAAQELTLRFGNTASDDDPFCEDPSQLVTMIAAGISWPVVGVTVEYNDGDYPWPPPNGNAGVFLTHGSSWQAMAEFYPLALVASGSSISTYARPYVAAGLHLSSDGEARADVGDGETWGVGGQTRPFVAAGVNGVLPLGARFGLTAGYRYTNVFFGDFDLITPDGPEVTVGGKSLNSSSVTVGLMLRL